ncbi:MAG: SH3 domain-containing protein [Clostridia bacterium]|nr:SH3 domain-containing protein [Clostridia bacterium]
MISKNIDRSAAGTISRGRGLSPVKTAAVLAALLALCGGIAGCNTTPAGPRFTSGPLPTADTDTTELPATVPATAAPTEAPTDTPVTETPTATTAPAVNGLFIGSDNPAALALIAGLAEPERVIMTPEQIAADNARMLRECDKLTGLAAMPDTLSREELQARLNAAKLPALPKYDKTGRAITQEEFDAICELRDIDAVPGQNPVRYGIVVKRADLRRLPSELSFYNAPDNPLDRIQETELYVGMPLRVLWRTADNAYYFVASYYYSGWTRADNVALCATEAEWQEFAAPERFAVITDALLGPDNAGGEYLDMGVKLPLRTAAESADDGLTVWQPVRNGAGMLEKRELTLPRASAHEGYLTFTYANFIAQAFKYEGTMYGWGGLDNGVDCSSFVASVLRAFGFYVPRDTSDQRTAVGDSRDAAVLTDAEKLALCAELWQRGPVVVYSKIHTLFYLGEQDGRAVYIHAPGAGKKVGIAYDRTLEDIIYICGIYGENLS